MPDLSGLPALDVVIGLAFMFFLLATACSAINEMVASYLGWRAKTLEDGVRSMLGEPTIRSGFKGWMGGLWDGIRGAFGLMPRGVVKPAPGAKPDLTTELFGHWRVKGLVRNSESKLRRRCRPSYLPPRALSLAVAEHFASLAPPEPGEAAAPTPWELTDAALAKKVEEVLKEADAPAVLKKAATNTFGNLEKFRANVERAFDDAMTRAQGWYKRKVQLVLLVIATALVVGLNVDTVHVGTRLWKDPALRAAVASQATAAVEPDKDKSGNVTKTPAEKAADAVDDVKQLDLPVGWGSDNAPHGNVGVLSSIPGWIITIAALTLGAPFWFDLLSRLARLRGSGGTQAGRALSDEEPAKGAG